MHLRQRHHVIDVHPGRTRDRSLVVPRPPRAIRHTGIVVIAVERSRFGYQHLLARIAAVVVSISPTALLIHPTTVVDAAISFRGGLELQSRNGGRRRRGPLRQAIRLVEDVYALPAGLLETVTHGVELRTQIGGWPIVDRDGKPHNRQEKRQHVSLHSDGSARPRACKQIKRPAAKYPKIRNEFWNSSSLAQPASTAECKQPESHFGIRLLAQRATLRFG